MSGNRPKLTAILFSYRGRIGRLAYLSGSLVVGVAALALIFVSVSLAGNDQGIAGSTISAASFLAALAALWPLSALLVKRLHDLNRSGWHGLWIALLLPLPNLLDDPFETVATVAALAVTLWLFFMPGTPGPNAYGERSAPFSPDTVPR